MEKIKEKLTDKKVLMPVLVVALILLLIEGLTYAWLVWRGNGEETQRIKGGTLELELDDLASAGIDLDPAIPMSDTQGKATRAYTFTVRNKGTLNASYILYLEDEDIEQGQVRLDDQYIKYSITKNNSSESALNLTDSINGDNRRELSDTIINAGGVDSYTLKLWIKGNATNEQIANKVFKAKIKLEAEQTTGESNEIPVSEGAGQTVETNKNATFTINESSSNFNGKVYIDNTEVDSNKYTVEGDDQTTTVTIDKSYITTLDEGNHILKVEYKDDKQATTTFTVEDYTYTNSHIKAAYTYNENGTGTGTAFTGCLGGEDAGCEQISLTSGTSVPTGTIVKYEVKDNDIRYFNVLYDKGNKLIMQQREHTLKNAKWNEENSEDGQKQGPITALSALENATNDWNYVNDISYSIGADDATLGYSGCNEGGVPSSETCLTNPYSLSKTGVKARMITAQEAAEIGTTFNGSTQLFMYNYLSSSYGYWTMTTTSGSKGGIYVNNYGYLYKDVSLNDSSLGLRAVIEINK